MKKFSLLRSYSADTYDDYQLGYQPILEDATSLADNFNASLSGILPSNFGSNMGASQFTPVGGSFVETIPNYDTDPYVSTLLNGRAAWSWAQGAPKVLKYCIRNYDGPTNDGSIITHYDAALVDPIRACIKAYADVLDIKFEEVSDTYSAQMVVQFVPLPPGVLGQSNLPSWETDHTWTGLSDGFLGCAPNDPLFLSTLIHELGHALGLAHSFEGVSFPGTNGDAWLPGDYNLSTPLATTMAYAGERRNITPMALDLAALQYLYGANTTTRTGDDSYEINDYGVYYRCIWDEGGVDQIIYRGNASVVIDLREATTQHNELGGGGISYSGSGSNLFTIAKRSCHRKCDRWLWQRHARRRFGRRQALRR